MASLNSDLQSMRSRLPGFVTGQLQRSAKHGFLGTMPLRDQLDHALGFAVSVESVLQRPPRSVFDLGTGGGLPGLVLAACWPETVVYLCDANERRTAFLSEEVAGEPKNTNVWVLRGRAEEIGRDPDHRQHFEVVVARSFGPPGVTAECTSPLVDHGGLVVVSEPPEEDSGDRWPHEGLAQLGLDSLESIRFDQRFGYRVFRKSADCPDRYPRRVGIPTKRPLF